MWMLTAGVKNILLNVNWPPTMSRRITFLSNKNNCEKGSKDQQADNAWIHKLISINFKEKSQKLHTLILFVKLSLVNLWGGNNERTSNTMIAFYRGIYMVSIYL